MKILRVAGQNLASLEKFDIAFCEGPLKQSGLFAITGPTGAGKSTILDAICLALYCNTPRTSTSNKVEVGHHENNERIRASDPRTLLRKGTGYGYAAVVFLGTDRQHYLAKCVIRRARNKPDGGLQSLDLSLYNVHGLNAYDIDIENEADSRHSETAAKLPTVHGGTRSETMELVEDLVGLSYDNFRRAVLLAQGDFAAFLKASPDERATLLERMTGTQIYAELSKAAHVKKTDAENAVKELYQELEALNILPPEERAQKTANLQALISELNAANEHLEKRSSQLAWYSAKEDRQNQIHSAQKRVDNAQSQWQLLESTRTTFSRVTAIQPLRAHIESLDTNQKYIDDQQRLINELETSLVETRQLVKENSEKALEYARAKDEAEQNKASQQPKIKEAEQLDILIDQAQQHYNECLNDIDGAEKRLAQLEKELTSISADINAYNVTINDAQQWLAQREFVRPVAEQWERWKTVLKRFQTSDNQLRQLKEKRLQLQESALEHTLQVKIAYDKREQFLAEQNAAKETLNKARQHAASFDTDALQKSHDTIVTQLDVARALNTLAREASTVAEDSQRLKNKRHETQQQSDKASAERNGAQNQHNTVLIQLEEAKRNLNAARNQRAMLDYRHELHEGEPCPLCGSVEHPSPPEQQAVNTLMTMMQERVDTLEKDSANHRAIVANIEKTIALHDQSITDITSSLEANLARLGDLQTQWDNDRSKLSSLPDINELPDDITNPQTIPTLLQCTEALRTQKDSYQELIQQANNAQATLRTAQNTFDTLRSHYDTADKEHQNQKDALQRIENEIAVVAKDVDLHEGIINEDLLELSQGFQDNDHWEQALRANPSKFIREWEHNISQWRTKYQAFEQANNQLQNKKPERAALEAKRQAQNDHLEEKRNSKKQLHQMLLDRTQKRRAYFDGLPVNKVVEQLQQHVDQAIDAYNTSVKSQQNAQEQLSMISTRLDETQKQLVQRQQDHDNLEKQLSAELDNHAITMHHARQLLSEYSAQWLSEQQVKIRAAETELTNAIAVLNEHQSQLEQFIQLNPQPDINKEDAQNSVTELKETVASLNDQLSRQKLELEQDDMRRDKAKELQEPILIAEENANLWKTMHDLIGSSDGKKFRIFAQSLTLDALLNEANHHLVDLAPRYALQRTPQSDQRSAAQDLELQVIDLDMGEDIRSITSLSGGETFLVSLALALGLSSLSARATQFPVESLFIDEGFGTLDIDTLEVALSTLDSLQARGCQVGIISHVSGLADNIGAQIKVMPTGNGSSKVKVVSAHAAA